MMIRLTAISVSVLAFGCCLFGIPFQALADSPAATQAAGEHEEEKKPGGLFTELFVGEKIYLQEKGEWYLIVTPAFAKAPDEKEFELEAEVIYGLTDQLQLSAEVPFVVVNPDAGSQHQGIGDLDFAANYNFIQTSQFALGVRAEFIVPTGDENRGLGGGQFAVVPALLAGFRFGDAELYASVGEFIGEDDDAFTYTVAGAYPWREFVGVLELTGLNGSGADVLYLTPGAYWNVTEKIQVGLGVPIGLTDDSDDYQIVGKISFEF
jgi:hypothetical protein